MINLLIDRMMRDIDDEVWNTLLCPQDPSPMLENEARSQTPERQIGQLRVELIKLRAENQELRDRLALALSLVRAQDKEDDHGQ